MKSNSGDFETNNKNKYALFKTKKGRIRWRAGVAGVYLLKNDVVAHSKYSQKRCLHSNNNIIQ